MLLYRACYRVPTARLPGADYAAPGGYFATWCTAHRAPVLGRMSADGMRLSPLGATVQDQVLGLHYEGVTLDAFVVMPDHVHVLVSLWPGAPSLSVVVNAFKANATRAAGRTLAV